MGEAWGEITEFWAEVNTAPRERRENFTYEKIIFLKQGWMLMNISDPVLSAEPAQSLNYHN